MNKFFILFGLVPSLVFAQSTDPLLSKLNFGEYPPGYTFIEAYDLSRPPLREQAKGEGRIVPIYFWYPGSEPTSSTMTFRSYLDDIAHSLGENVERESVSGKAREIFADYHFDIPDSIIQAYTNLEIKTLACRDIPLHDGKFPVVVFNHGNVDRWWVWGEFLASHGIAVVGTPNAGTFRKRHEMGLSGLETQIRDAQFAVSIVTKNKNIDGEFVIAAGSSYGSLAATGFATRDKRVKGVISLDGIIADVNEGELITQTPYFDYQRFTTPILHVNSGFSWSSNYTLMDRLIYADQYRIDMRTLRHSDYHFEGMADLYGCNFRGGELVDNSAGFKSLTAYALAFIKGITGEPEQLKLLSSRLEEAEKAVFVEGGASYSASELLSMIRVKGFNEVVKIYQSKKEAHPQPFSPETFYEVGLTLHRYRMIEEEIIWFEFYKESFPKSADAYYRLARLKALTGNQELGRKMLNETKQMIPNDPHISEDRKTYLLSRVDYFLNR
ncbi:MAG: hypothetical protein ABJP45_06800 [Cyclobacteriaceae bacterium]